jgi:hypothetical protein
MPHRHVVTKSCGFRVGLSKVSWLPEKVYADSFFAAQESLTGQEGQGASLAAAGSGEGLGPEPEPGFDVPPELDFFESVT